jgi:CubicO group peptidase (beta-lactamase class C family)
MLKSTPLEYPPGKKYQYSDLGFMLLCRVVQKVTHCPMHRFLRTEVYDPMGLADLFFVDLNDLLPMLSPPAFRYAATELCPIRNRLLIGEVHDDNAWFAGGVDGHAGLFGTAEAVFQLLRILVGQFNDCASPVLFSSKILSEIFQLDNPRRLPLGFDRPAEEHSSAGTYFSEWTIGHLGYTGVSFWLDLQEDVTVILLTNRVHPTRWNNRLVHFRPRIHDQIMEHFEIVPN